MINPISPFIIITRDLLFNETITDLRKSIIVFTVSLVIFFIGWVFYRLSFPFLIERMDA
jgi:lipopolysaccharide transport system permease protein